MENTLFNLLERKYTQKQLDAVLELLTADNTVPFIARYRKEATGNLDEVQIREIQDTQTYLVNLTTRQQEVLRLIDELDLLTPEIEASILEAKKLQTLEDIYRPFRPKRRTKATIAKEQGLEPFALAIFHQEAATAQALYESKTDQSLDFETALAGAHEIMAEKIGDDPRFRSWIRTNTMKHGSIITTLKDESLDTRHVYEMYYTFNQPLLKCASHHILAFNRAEKEGVIKVEVAIEEAPIMAFLRHFTIDDAKSQTHNALIEAAYSDAYKRFIRPAIERETRNELTEKAEQSAIEVFGDNLKHLLLQAPLKGRTVMGFDPAFRTGCKLAIVDETGLMRTVGVIFPHHPAPRHERERAITEFQKLLKQYNVDIVAIGNGTASRESEEFVAKHKLPDVSYVIVNEAGASVYSASDLARQEFPKLQVEERSAISIARRLQDPLAELVKIEPKAVGVGQYQHDVNQKTLSDTLNVVVEDVVNAVGVDVNTASPKLLAYVSGISATLAQNIVDYREAHGAFKDRKTLKKVPRMGPKSYEQSVGFLRILGGHQILDATAIHPESYDVTLALCKAAGINFKALGTAEVTEMLNHLVVDAYTETLNAGKATLLDIVSALKAPGRDIRDDASGPMLRSDVLELKDLKPGMELQGTVRNVVDFGAFVDIGVTQDGLVHISKLSNSFVKHPKDIVSVGDIVTVWVEDVDVKKQRIQLSMIKNA